VIHASLVSVLAGADLLLLPELHHEHRFTARCAKIYFRSGFCGADQGCSIQPSLIDIKNEDAVPIERDFFGIPGGFVAVVGVPTERKMFGIFSWVGRDPIAHVGVVEPDVGVSVLGEGDHLG